MHNLVGFYFDEQFSKCRLAAILVFLGRDFSFGLQHFFGDLKQLAIVQCETSGAISFTSVK